VRLYETFRVKVRRLPITKFTALVSRTALVIRVRRSRYAQSGRRLRLLWLLLWLILVPLVQSTSTNRVVHRQSTPPSIHKSRFADYHTPYLREMANSSARKAED
jgi:hypothetical protein